MASPSNVAEFVERVGLDEKAQKALSDLPAQDQHIVMKLMEGEIERCRNPSAVTWTKIKAVKEQPLHMKAEFLRQELDDPSFAALQALPVHVQEVIVHDIDVVRSRNLSAVVWTKMKSMGLNTPTGSPAAAAARANGEKMPADPAAIEAKVAEMCLDDGAQEALSKLSPSEQMAVLSQVNMEVVRNPSAVVIKKIRERKSTTVGTGSNGTRAPIGMSGAMASAMGSARDRSRTPPPSNMMMAIGYGGYGAQNMMAMQMQAPMFQRGPVSNAVMAGLQGLTANASGFGHVMSSLDSRAQQAVSQLEPEEQQIVLWMVGQENCKNPSAVAWSKVKKVKENFAELKVEFVRKQLDEGSAKAVGELPPETQESLLADVDISRVRNLSAVVWSKVKSAHGGVPPPSSMSSTPRMGGAGRKGNAMAQLDSKASEALSALPPNEQQRILGELEGMSVNNPSAVVWSKVKAYHGGAPPPSSMQSTPRAGGRGGNSSANLDSRATDALLGLPDEEQQRILEELETMNINNPSAFVWSKVKAYNGGAPPASARTSTPRMSSGGGGAANLDARASEALAGLSDYDQQRIMEELQSTNVKNPSAFVWSKVKKLQNGGF